MDYMGPFKPHFSEILCWDGHVVVDTAFWPKSSGLNHDRTGNTHFLGRCWSPVSFPKAKLNSKLHFQIRLCFGSWSLHLKRGNISHILSFSLCLQAVIVKMQIAVKYWADIISMLTLHPFCYKGLLFFFVSLLFLLPFSGSTCSY